MKPTIFLSALAASLLAACAAPVAQAPTPSAAPAAAATEDDQSRAIHGSTLKVGLGDTSGMNVTVNQPASGGTSSCTPSAPAQFQFASDSMQMNRMAFWNPIDVDPNGGSNANYGNDVHVQLILPNNLPAGMTISKVSLLNVTTGGNWDSFGYPSHQFVGVYSPNGLDQLLHAGNASEASPVTSGQYLNLYIDTGSPEHPENVFRAGDIFNITVDSSIGPQIYNCLTLH